GAGGLGEKQLFPTLTKNFGLFEYDSSFKVWLVSRIFDSTFASKRFCDTNNLRFGIFDENSIPNAD
ncbi:hypothetical protein, partial [Nostoc sp. NOS(2021)]|uniref:hypothetical protein n=1 Tax=Nostoc sp. NOS(2021) TaxID=2815407 RepID=UPI0025E69214